MLLPHGYEGQGPDHSSARLERYLELSAQQNWRIANCTTAAQYFHLLRQQAFLLEREPRPLVIMTPKSLLRHPLSLSRLQDLAEGAFQSVIDDRNAREHTDRIRRIILCTGKMAIDLLGYRNRIQSEGSEDTAEDIAIIRVEMLYPFPGEVLKSILGNYPQAREIVWVQEEPRNMGAWSYMSPRLREVVDPAIPVNVISRPDRSSPAAGFWDLYAAEQERIITEACTLPLRQPGGNYVR